MANRRRRNSSQRVNGSNRLIGWLVSYGLDANGESFEIRAGRTMIGSRGNSGDRAIAITEETISAPHSALSASTRHTLTVQDIFSNHGSYISKAGSSSENKINGPVELEHGDWLRIGKNTRLQVCLIDGPSQ